MNWEQVTRIEVDFGALLYEALVQEREEEYYCPEPRNRAYIEFLERKGFLKRLPWGQAWELTKQGRSLAQQCEERDPEGLFTAQAIDWLAGHESAQHS